MCIKKELMHLWALAVLLVLCQCNGYREAPLTEVERDSVLVADLKAFRQERASDLETTTQKIGWILASLDTLKPKALPEKYQISLKFPACGGYSDSCRFDYPDLALSITKEQLSQTKNEWHELTPHDIQRNVRNFWAIHTQEYRPINHQFKDTPFLSVQRQMTCDFYDVRMLFQAKWLLLLDIQEYKSPISEYGGGKMQGKWHIFDFQRAVYQGSILLQASNTSGFRPPQQTSKQVESIKETQRYDGKRFTTDRSKVVTQEQVATTQKQQYYYAEKNLLDNFKTQMQTALKQIQKPN